MPLTRDARAVWQSLNGVFCVYKPADFSISQLRKSILSNLTRDLNSLDVRPAEPFISIEARNPNALLNADTKLSIQVQPSYADNALVLGARYQPRDIKMMYIGRAIQPETSGVSLLGINSGNHDAHSLSQESLMRVFHVSARLGRETDSGFYERGKATMKANYKHVPREAIDRVLAAIQAAHQRQAFNYAKMEPTSQEAYEIVKKEGVLIPEKDKNTPSLIYGARCIKFEPPDFTIEVHSLCETQSILLLLVSEVGRRVRSAASTLSLRCVRHGPFTTEHALSRTHWDLKHVIHNLGTCRPLVEQVLQERRARIKRNAAAVN